jgi:ribosomal protein RSM22 (predicted rRNA methylase)
MSVLPPALQQALAERAIGQGRSELAVRSSAITAGYQKRQNSSRMVLRKDDALAYALSRMPATYAATRRVFMNLAEVAPDFAPTRLLDVGCGPGTASFAASTVFSTLKGFTLLDRNGPFLELARSLFPAVLPPEAAMIVASELNDPAPLPQADLVVASYVLAELDAGLRQALIPRLWAAAGQALVLVEPGTPDGFMRLREARTWLIAAGGHIAAPCTHEGTCPMTADNWCRSFERVQRSRDHRLLKGGERPFEDEPYAYLAVTRMPVKARPVLRIIGRPVVNKVEALLPVCGPEGLSTLRAPSRDKKFFKEFRYLEWGDAVLNPIQAVEALNQKGFAQAPES